MWNINRALLTDKIHLSIKGRRTANGKFDWSEAVCDSSIISGITFFTGIGALTAANGLNINGLTILFASVGVEFLSFLAMKRGLIQKNSYH